MKRFLLSLVLLTGTVLTLAGCEPEPPRQSAGAPAAAQRMEMSDRLAAQKDRNPYLALEHHYRIELPEDRIPDRLEATADQCTEGDFHGCTLLDTNLNRSERHVSANIRVRVGTEGVETLVGIAARGGEVTSRNSRAEDLAETVMDTDKRLEMLRSYRERLQGLEDSAGQDIESLIKVSSELSKVQSEIEQLQGRRDHLQKRLDLDLLNIYLYADDRDDLSAPIADALDRFLYNLSSAVSSIITVVAWALPWIAGLLLIILAFRGWRRVRRRSR